MTTEEQLKLLRGRLAPLLEQFDSIIEQVNELFETGYNEFIDAAEDPDDEEIRRCSRLGCRLRRQRLDR